MSAFTKEGIPGLQVHSLSPGAIMRFVFPSGNSGFLLSLGFFPISVWAGIGMGGGKGSDKNSTQ